MTYIEKMTFLNNVRETVRTNPDILNETIQACTSGISIALTDMTHQAIDMETVVIAMHSTINEKYKKSTQEWIDKLVANKISPYTKNSYTANLNEVLKDFK